MSLRDGFSLLLALSLITAGCGGGSSTKPVASTPGGAPAPAMAAPMAPPEASGSSSASPMGATPMSPATASTPASTPMTAPMTVPMTNPMPAPVTTTTESIPMADPMPVPATASTADAAMLAQPMTAANVNPGNAVPMGTNPMPGVGAFPGANFPPGMLSGQNARPSGPLPGSFLALAQTAMKAGKEREAIQFLCAHYAVHGGDDLAKKMNWVDGLKRPALAVRIGIGVVFTAPPDFRGDPQPIGRMAAAPAGTTKPGEKKPRKRFGQRTQNQQQQQTGPAAKIPNDPLGTLVFFTGELGEGLLDRLDEREGPQGLGVALTELTKQPATPANAAGGVNPMNAAMLPMEIPMGVQAGGETVGEGTDLRSREPQSLGPGITLLGVQPDDKALKKRAKEQGVDALIIFDVDVRPARASSLVNNSTKITLYSLAQDDSLVTTREINNQKVADDRAKSRETDVVETEMERLFETFDKHFRMKELPAAITPERVLTRVQNLAKQLPDNPAALGLLAEMRFYQAKGLVSQVDIVMALQEALGEETVGKLLAAQTDQDKIDLFSTWFTVAEEEEKDKKKRETE